MAAISMSPGAARIELMSTRRPPLADNPNAANSPYRAVAAAAQKRSREQNNAQEESSYGHIPPAKRQAVAVDRPTLRTPSRKLSSQPAEGRVFNRRPINGQPVTFEPRLLAVESNQDEPKDDMNERSAESLNDIRQWQKHYRRVFPYFVFYFESIPEDIRARCSKAIKLLGAVSWSQKDLIIITDSCILTEGRKILL